MHKAELIDAVITTTSLPRAEVDAVCSALLECIMGSTAAGEKVTVAGFGTFEARTRAARQGRNPATGEPLQIAATRAVGFKAGTAFKQLVAGAPVSTKPAATKSTKLPTAVTTSGSRPQPSLQLTQPPKVGRRPAGSESH